MPGYSKNDISDLSSYKVRPAVVVHAPHVSQDIFTVSLTRRTTSLLAGEFVLSSWVAAGLNVETAVKRGLYTVHQSIVITLVGSLTDSDAKQLEQSLRSWLGLS